MNKNPYYFIDTYTHIHIYKQKEREKSTRKEIEMELVWWIVMLEVDFFPFSSSWRVQDGKLSVRHSKHHLPTLSLGDFFLSLSHSNLKGKDREKWVEEDIFRPRTFRKGVNQSGRRYTSLIKQQTYYYSRIFFALLLPLW